MDNSASIVHLHVARASNLDYKINLSSNPSPWFEGEAGPRYECGGVKNFRQPLEFSAVLFSLQLQVDRRDLLPRSRNRRKQGGENGLDWFLQQDRLGKNGRDG